MVAIASHSRHEATSTRSVPTPLRARTLVGVGALVAMITAVGAGIPSYWGDEAASVMSAQRSLPSLLQELGAVDAVHGLYYMLLHVWIWMFGAGEWATRSLSVVAIGFLAAGVIALGERWFDSRTAITAGLLIAIMPRSTGIAIETRGYAITAAIVVWLMVMFTTLFQRRARRSLWVLFAVLAGMSSWFFMYSLLVPAIACACGWLLAARRRGTRHGLRRDLLIALSTMVAVASPILLMAALQRNQISFLAHRSYLNVHGILVTPWFDNAATAVVMWGLIVVGTLFAVIRAGQRTSMLLAGAWLVVPGAVLLALDLWVAPTYSPRYLTISLAAVALLAARGVTAVVEMLARPEGWRRGLVIAVQAVLMLGVTVPVFLHQRTPYAKDGGADFQQTAQFVATHAHIGDAVLFGAGPRPSRTARLTYRLYPTAFEGLQDPQLRLAYDQRAGLWDDLYSVSEVAPALSEHTVWLLESSGAESAEADKAALRVAGYTLRDAHTVHRTTAYEFVQGGTHE